MPSTLYGSAAHIRKLDYSTFVYLLTSDNALVVSDENEDQIIVVHYDSVNGVLISHVDNAVLVSPNIGYVGKQTLGYGVLCRTLKEAWERIKIYNLEMFRYIPEDEVDKINAEMTKQESKEEQERLQREKEISYIIENIMRVGEKFFKDKEN